MGSAFKPAVNMAPVSAVDLLMCAFKHLKWRHADEVIFNCWFFLAVL